MFAHAPGMIQGMRSEIADRFARVAAGFTDRAARVPAEGWARPAPCEGWVARDVVGHLVEWMPALFLDSWGFDRPPIPAVDVEPVAAWVALRDALQRRLDDPDASSLEADIRPGRFRFDVAVDQFGTNDVLIHTWDLARATGLDERLPAWEVHRMLDGIEPLDEVLRRSGQYGPRVEVPDDADEQSRLLAFLGRRP